jgi:hypothetical protein
MLKQTAAGAVLIAMMITGAACSSQKDQPASAATATPAVTASTAPQAAEDAASFNMKGYIAARMAQEKIDFIFTESKTKDGSNTILNPIANSKEAAVKFISAYVDAPLADNLAAHYITDQKAGDAIITNKTAFVPTKLLDTKKEDITFDAANTKDLVKFTTKDGVVFTTKKVNDKFILSDIAKK